MSLGHKARVITGLLSAHLFVGCGFPCEEPLPLESGTYVVTARHYGQLQPGDEWVRDAIIGARVVIDSEAGMAVIRYDVDGATVEIRFRLEER